MRVTALLAAAGVLFIAPASAQSPHSAGQPAGQPPQQAPAEQRQEQGTTGVAPASDLSPEFVRRVAISDMFEIQSSELAREKAGQSSVKTFADHMVQAHEKTSSELKSLIQSGKVRAEIPTQMDELHAQELDSLRQMSGPQFAFAYKNMQLKAHRDAITLFTSYVENGDNPELKQWAASKLPALKEHFDMAQEMQER